MSRIARPRYMGLRVNRYAPRVTSAAAAPGCDSLGREPFERRERRLRIPGDRLARNVGGFPAMPEERFDLGLFRAHARVPFRHVPRLGGIELEAEPVARLAVLRQDSRDERLVAAREAHGMHVDEGEIDDQMRGL